MGLSFALFRRTLAVLALAAGLAPAAAGAASPAPVATDMVLPAGGKYHDCHGYIRGFSATSVKVHCIDGDASDQGFLIVPHVDAFAGGKGIAVRSITPETPVHVIYTQALGVKQAYRIYVTGAAPAGAPNAGK